MGQVQLALDALKAIKAGGQIADGIPKFALGPVAAVAEAVINYACPLYHNFPLFTTYEFTPLGVLNPFHEMVLQKLCDPASGIPDSGQQKPFSGGQCPVMYTVNIHIEHNGGQPLNYYGDATGPIGGVDVPWTSWVSGYPPPGVSILDPNGKTVGIAGWDAQSGGGGTFEQSGAYIVGVKRKDGLPDDCGNVPGIQPYPVPRPDQTNVTVNMPVTQTDAAGNKTVNNYNLSISTPSVAVGDRTSINIPISINNVPTTINLGLDGMTIAPPSFVDLSQNSQIATQISSVATNLNSLIFAPSGSLNPTVNTPAQEGKATDKKGMRIVTIDLTQVPTNTSVHVGSAQGDVYKAGYFNFTRGGYLLMSEPVRFRHSCFIAPQAADGYTYNLYIGFEGYATEYTV